MGRPVWPKEGRKENPQGTSFEFADLAPHSIMPLAEITDISPKYGRRNGGRAEYFIGETIKANGHCCCNDGQQHDNRGLSLHGGHVGEE